ncbi:hypothetical protein N656DRAFT_588257 [Canariomyces notabilis]|uniref:Uncharacterized protein n=1 Tax=Canariomyces notabilis TaxID=2074819 RepID=A0AAN6YVC3_9PEZI|nr:hypothetical protein N656DRAFT_588257 [Canariomyces arenarius]
MGRHQVPQVSDTPGSTLTYLTYLTYLTHSSLGACPLLSSLSPHKAWGCSVLVLVLFFVMYGSNISSG